MLHNVCQELTAENVSDFLFLCEHQIARSRRDQIKNPRDLLYALEQLKLVAPDSLHFLSSKLAEIRRQDLARKVEEHCQRHGVQHLRGDWNIQPNSDSKVGGQSAPSLISDTWKERPNQAVSYNPARCLERDDAVPLIPLMPASENTDRQEIHVIPQTPDDGVGYDYGGELVARGIAASSDADMPCYTMDKIPRGNVYTAVFKSLLIISSRCYIQLFFSFSGWLIMST